MEEMYKNEDLYPSNTLIEYQGQKIRRVELCSLLNLCCRWNVKHIFENMDFLLIVSKKLSFKTHTNIVIDKIYVIVENA